MQLKQISILNYKNIGEATIEFSPNINCFIGNNGMGKTNVLDAIYYLSFCKSHTNAIDSQNINHDADFLLLQGTYDRNGTIDEVYCGLKRRQKKQFKRNKKDYERLSDHIGLLPLVLISPSDIELINDGSEERRKFIDGVISQYDKQYLQHLLSYNNALKQRNALLKMDVMPDATLFEVWEEQMVFHAEYIHAERVKFVSEFVESFQEYYSIISDKKEQVSLEYKSQLLDRDLRKAFVDTRGRDHILGYTTQGIHKDDLGMSLGEYQVKRVGSQGQNKTYLIALKLAQFDFLKRAHGISPLLLLDDVFDKLDAHRVRRIMEMVASERFGQIFITDTNREHLDSILEHITQDRCIFHVDQGTISD